MTTRRQFLATGLGAAAATTLSKAAFAANYPSLKEMGQRAGLLVGATLLPSQLPDERLTSFVTSQFAMLTPDYALKWVAIRPTQDKFDFNYADKMVQFAESHGMRIHGHNLCWNDSNPGWVNAVVNPGNARQILETHINTVMTRYRGKIDSWDVVNEPISSFSPRPDGLRAGPWLNNLGPEYIDIALDAAKRADPGPLRVINFNGLEQPTPRHQRNCGIVLQLFKEWVKRGVPVQGVGLESHLDASMPVKSAELTSFVQGVRALGIEVLITELDIDDTRIEGGVEQRKQAVADTYEQYLEYMLPLADCKRLIFWTPTDKHNSIDSLAAQNAYEMRKDRQLHLPGLLDDQMNPNPALAAVENALSRVSRTSAGLAVAGRR